MVVGGGPDTLGGSIVRLGACRRRSALLLGRGGARRRIASRQTDRRGAAFARRLRFQIDLERTRRRLAQPLVYGIACAVTVLLLFAATPSRASLPPDGGVRDTIAMPALFGTCEIRSDNIGEFPQWTAMLSLLEKIERANAAIDRYREVPTERSWHRAMYREAPFQLLRRGGPCQDYTGAKYPAARQANGPADLMRVVVRPVSNVGQDHRHAVAER